MPNFWSQLSENQGLELALAGILLVFSVLILVSLYISLLPKILRVVGPVLDRLGSEKDTGEELESVAVAVAMHAHLNQSEI